MSATEPAPGAVAAQETGAPAEHAPPVYADVEGFVVGFLAPTIARLMALWEAWEALRLDGGTAMGTWWRDHCGPQLGVLMNGEEGPLHLCKPDHHGGIPAPLKSAPAPPEWWGPAQR